MNINIFLPEYITFEYFSFNTLYFFYAVALILWFFSIWYEGRRDGFDQERLIDLGFLILLFKIVSFISVKRYIEYITIFDPYNILLSVDTVILNLFIPFIISILSIIYICKFWNWSKYRILDIYASTISQVGFVISLGYFLVYKINAFIPLVILLPVIYLLILRLRSFKFISGLTFSIFVLLSIPYIFLFYRGQGYLYFCTALATISIINFYLRRRKNYAGTTSFGRVYKTVQRKTSTKRTRTKKRN